VARLLALVALFSVVTAAAVVVVAGVVTPGYDPMARTISRLAVPGSPAAFAVDLAIGLVALACFALAAAIASAGRVGAVATSVAGLGFMGAALIHLDPAEAGSTLAHRAASGAAVVGLTIASLRLGPAYGRISLVLGAVELGTLAVGLALLATPFGAWGAWERWLLAVTLAWMLWLALAIVSRHEKASARTASISSAVATPPVSSVTSANR